MIVFFLVSVGIQQTKKSINLIIRMKKNQLSHQEHEVTLLHITSMTKNKSNISR